MGYGHGSVIPLNLQTLCSKKLISHSQRRQIPSLRCHYRPLPYPPHSHHPFDPQANLTTFLPSHRSSVTISPPFNPNGSPPTYTSKSTTSNSPGPTIRNSTSSTTDTWATPSKTGPNSLPNAMNSLRPEDTARCWTWISNGGVPTGA